MRHKKFKKLNDNWYTDMLGDHPVYYVRSHVSYALAGTVYEISSDRYFRRYHILDEYTLYKHFIPALDICSNIFMKVT